MVFKFLKQGSAGSGGGAVMEPPSITNGSRLGDPFSASGSVGSGSIPHGSHFYGPTAGMGVVSPPSLDTLGLSSSSNPQGHGVNAGLSNGTHEFRFLHQVIDAY